MTKTFEIDEFTLKMMIMNLKDSIQVCYESPQIDGQGYPYATGYSRSCMIRTVEILEALEAGN